MIFAAPPRWPARSAQPVNFRFFAEMAHQVPTYEPDTITAGDLITWKKSLGDYPAGESWTLSYALTNSAAQITFTGTADDDDHLISVSAATSAAWAAGTYSIQGYVTKALERYLVYKERHQNTAQPSHGFGRVG